MAMERFQQSALDYSIDANLILEILMGALLIIIGNYLPKCRQNYTIGIKIPWTLADEDNWNRTHRPAVAAHRFFDTRNKVKIKLNEMKEADRRHEV